MNRCLHIVVGLLALLMPAGAAAAEPPTLTIAAAADLNFALTDLGAQFERQTGARVRLSFGSSGNLFMQIQNGAPFDLFFSADLDHPRRLEAAGLVEPGTLRRYARGQLVLWVPTGTTLDSDLDLERLGIKALLQDAVKRIAIANPQHAPYGRAAVAALRHFGLYDQVAPKLVLGENVGQAAQFVHSGNAQAGIIALSFALAPTMKDKGRYWLVPQDSYPAIEQGAVVLKRSPHQVLARRFLEFLKTPAATAILKRYGFLIPEAA